MADATVRRALAGLDRGWSTTAARLHRARPDEGLELHGGEGRASARVGSEHSALTSRPRRSCTAVPAAVAQDVRATLASTNLCASMIDSVRRTSRNVKLWHDGDVCLRWTAGGMLEAERRTRRVSGSPQLARLAVAVEREVAAHTIVDTPAPEVAATGV